MLNSVTKKPFSGSLNKVTAKEGNMGKPLRKIDITQLKHPKKKRKNNPAIGLVSNQTEPLQVHKTKKYTADEHIALELSPDPNKIKIRKVVQWLSGSEPEREKALKELKKMAKPTFDEHSTPQLQFDSKRAKVENIIDQGLSGGEQESKQALKQLKNMQTPFLNWAGKPERASFEVPTVSLHTHERIDPRAVIERVRKTNTVNYEQLSLFKKEQLTHENSAIDFYQHEKHWKNRLIAGDSLLVMNSLMEKEGMAGKVQCIYMDPPYGIRYKSNFQPFTSKRDVKDTDKDEDLTAEPEMLKAFRDTWELRIHSYLSYLRDRLLLARELLTESGSCFVQISDENVHLVRNLMDEIFGKDCFVVSFPVKKKGSQKSSLIAPVNDYLLWYSKSKKSSELIKYRSLFVKRPFDSDNLDGFRDVEINNQDYSLKDLKNPKGELFDYSSNPSKVSIDYPEVKFFRADPLQCGGVRKNQSVPFIFKGTEFKPKEGSCWKTTAVDRDGKPSGMKLLAKNNRLVVKGRNLYYRRYFSDFEYKALSNWWDNLGGASNQIYVVQTNEEIIQRCILMTTDPGDLVFDPTCGSGTTAYVAEKWGRRWITCDTSRVATTLAKQRLMTSVFDYYKLKNQDEGISSGFQYKTVPHITLGSIANNEPPKEEVLYDQPLKDTKKARVTGPFTVEAVPSQAVLSVGQEQNFSFKYEWLEEARKSGIKGKKGIATDMNFARLEKLPGFKYLHAEGETTNPRKILISFGPEHAPMDKRHVELALKEMESRKEKVDILAFVSFHFDPSASRLIDEYQLKHTKAIQIQMNMDLQSADLKKKTSSESFWLVGAPDVEIKLSSKKEEYTVEVQGWDYYNPATGKIESGGQSKIAMWLLDTDYDGKAVFPRQVFFPMAGKKDGWAKLAKSLKSEIDMNLIEKYRGTRSLPFEAGKHQKVAVKIVDDRGIGSLKVLDLSKAKKQLLRKVA